MKPRKADDAAVQTAWAPVMVKVPEELTEWQITENVLQMQAAAGVFRNAAPAAGIAATGCRWRTSIRNGFLDLYTVNGMNAAELFSHLPDNEPVETDWTLRNDRAGGFLPAPEWRMGCVKAVGA